MRRSLRGRTIDAAAISIAAHAVLLSALWVYAPRLRVPDEEAGPPQAIIPVLILPRVPPAEAGGPPSPIRLHRRQLRALPAELPVKPLVAPEPKEEPRPATGPATLEAAESDRIASGAQQALRGGLVGCANPDLLSRAERERCSDLLARRGQGSPSLGLGIERDKAGDFARAAARKEADVRYKESAPPPATAPTGGPGKSAEDVGRSLGNDRPALKVPF